MSIDGLFFLSVRWRSRRGRRLRKREQRGVASGRTARWAWNRTGRRTRRQRSFATARRNRGGWVRTGAPRSGVRPPRRSAGRCASLRARGGVRADRSPVRRARARAGRGDDRGSRARGCGAREGRNAACGEPARGGGRARDRADRGRGARDDRADEGGPGPRTGADAGLGGPGTSQQGSAHGRAEGGGEADPVGARPRGRRPGLCRDRQDHHARPGKDARGEEGVPHDRPRALGLGGADAQLRSRDRERDPAALPRAQRRRCRGKAHEERREGDACGVRGDRARGRRGLARLHRPGPRPAAYRERAPHPPGGAGRRREAARRGRCGKALRPAPGRRHADRRDGRDHAPARSGAQTGRRGEPRGRDRQGVSRSWATMSRR